MNNGKKSFKLHWPKSSDHFERSNFQISHLVGILIALAFISSPVYLKFKKKKDKIFAITSNHALTFAFPLKLSNSETHEDFL